MTFNNSIMCWKLAEGLAAVKLNIKLFLTLNTSACFVGIIGNALFLIVLLRSEKLKSPSNTLLGAVSVNDLFSCCVVQPLYFVFCWHVAFDQKTKINILKAVDISLSYCGGLTVIYIAVLSIDRYIAICQPVFYRRSVSCKTHISIAFLCALVWSLVVVLENSHHQQFQFMFILSYLIAILVVVYTYVEIFKEIFHQKRYCRILVVST